MDDDPIDAWKPLALSVSTTRRCLTATCAGVGSEGDDNAAEQIPDVEVMQPAGFFAHPALTATSEAIAVRRGDELIALFLVDKGAAAQAVESGETRLYGVGASNAAAVIRIRASGAIVIAASGASVTVTGSGVDMLNASQPFVRGTDLANALAAFGPATATMMAAVGTALGAINTYAVAIQAIADPTNAATPTLTTALTTTFDSAKTTFNNALTALVGASGTYLSTVIRGQ